MGTLRIKRGTKTALQDSPGYTPLEGELVYTTDTKEVFVGDGATTGGTPVSVSTQNLEDLGNVQALAAQKDQILVYNGSNWAATNNPALDLRGNIYGDDSTLLVDAINGQIVGPINTTSIVSSGNIVGDLVGDVTGSVTGNLVGDTAGSHFGNVTGDITGDVIGSVFGDDSTLIVNGINNTVSGEIVGTINAMQPSTFDNNIDIGTKSVNPNVFYYNTTVPGAFPISTFQLRNVQDSAISHEFGFYKARGTITNRTSSLAGDSIGGFAWSARDDAAGNLIAANMTSVINSVSTGSISADIIIRTRNGAVGTYGEAMRVKSDKGVVTQDYVEAGGYVQFGSLTTAERDALTAANGMVIYNSSTNKFQGYENGAWVNLV